MFRRTGARPKDHHRGGEGRGIARPVRALESINEWLRFHDDLDDYEPVEEIDAVIDVYTSDLTAWLNDRPSNIEYLTEVLCEFQPKDGFQLLTMAQALAIEEAFAATAERVRLLLAEQERCAPVAPD